MAIICSRNWASLGGFTVKDCRPTIPGCAGRAWVYDWDTFQQYTVVWNSSNVSAMDHCYIKTITVPTTGSSPGMRIESFGMPYVGSVNISDETYFVKIQHQVVIRVYQRSLRAKELMDSLMYTNCIIVLENLDIGSDTYWTKTTTSTPGASEKMTQPGMTKFEIYGLDAGMRLSSLNMSTDLTDQAAYEITFSSDSDVSESSVPVSVYSWTTDTDTPDTVIAKTRTMLDTSTSDNPTSENYDYTGARKKFFGNMGVTTFTPAAAEKSNGRADSGHDVLPSPVSGNDRPKKG